MWLPTFVCGELFSHVDLRKPPVDIGRKVGSSCSAPAFSDEGMKSSWA